MRAKTVKKEYLLTPEVCDEIGELVMEYCTSIGTERKDALRHRLSAEECLVYWLEHGCAGKRVLLTLGRYLLTPRIEIAVEGAAINPYAEDDPDFGFFTDSILVSLRLGPEYSYADGFNCIRFRLKKKPLNPLAKTALVIVSGLLTGLIGLFLLSDGLRASLLAVLVEPIYDVFFRFLGCIAGPMIFLSVAWGVYGIGDAATLGKIGKTMMLRFVGVTLLFCACATPLYPLLGPAFSGGTNGAGQLSSVAELILGIFPSTIVEPFATGNTMQIIFLALVIGIALLFLGRQTSRIAHAIEEVNLIVQFLMELISRLVPEIIFLVIVKLIWSGGISVMTSTWKLLAVLIGALVSVSACMLLYTALRQKASVLLLLRKSMPTFLVALTTASSAAAFSSNITTCEKNFGIEPSLIRFGIPLGMVMHKPVTAIYNLLLTFFFAKQYGVSCSVSWLVLAVVICTIISISTPPIPGGGAVAYSVIFAQMGIPAEALTVVLALDLITDFLITAFEMLALPLSLVNVSSSLGRLDPEILRRP